MNIITLIANVAVAQDVLDRANEALEEAILPIIAITHNLTAFKIAFKSNGDSFEGVEKNGPNFRVRCVDSDGEPTSVTVPGSIITSDDPIAAAKEYRKEIDARAKKASEDRRAMNLQSIDAEIAKLLEKRSKI